METGIIVLIVTIILVIICGLYAKNDDIYRFKLNQVSIANIPKDDRIGTIRDFAEVIDLGNRKKSEQNDFLVEKFLRGIVLSDDFVRRNHFVYTIDGIHSEMNGQESNSDRQEEETRTASQHQEHSQYDNTDRQGERLSLASQNQQHDLETNTGREREESRLAPLHHLHAEYNNTDRQIEETQLTIPHQVHDQDNNTDRQTEDTCTASSCQKHDQNSSTDRPKEKNIFLTNPQQDPNTPPSVLNRETCAGGRHIIATSVTRMPNRNNAEPIKRINQTTRNICITREVFRYPGYRMVFSRWASFRGSPFQRCIMLANAGLFYTGYGDCVRCFCCGIGLRDWEADDDPWVEHARWSPDCKYVLMVKGQDFIDLVRRHARMPNSLQQETPVRGHGETPLVIGEARRQQEQTLRFPLQTPAAQEAISLGFYPRMVKDAIEILVNDYGWNFLSVELLLQILTVTMGASINIQEETTETDDKVDKSHLTEENTRLKEQLKCKICLDEKAEIVFLPCGHLCCCAQCAPVLPICPICRQGIKGTVRVSLP